MNWRGHNGSFSIPNDFMFSFQGTVISLKSLDSGFLWRLWEEFSDISNSLNFLDIKKAGLRNSILNDWLLDVPWQLTLWRLCKPKLASDVPSQLPLSELLQKDWVWDWQMTFASWEARDAQNIIPGPTPLSCVPAQPQLCKLPLFQLLSAGLGSSVCAWDSGVMRALPQLSAFSLTLPTDPKETCGFATLSWALFYLTIIICGCLDASWGSMFWRGSASPLSQELLEELTANRFSLPQCGLMSNSAQWELTSWQTQSISGGWRSGERTSLVHAFKRHRAISQMGRQSSCKWYQSIFNSLSISLEAGAGARDTGIKDSVPGTK